MLNKEDADMIARLRASGGLPVYPTKICKFCVQPIPLDALVCKFCTRDVNTEEEATEMLKNYVKTLVKQR